LGRLSVRVLSRLFRRLFLEALAPLRKIEWVVYAKRPFAGPKSVLQYLSRYTHRVAISNHRLLAFDERGVTIPVRYRTRLPKSRHPAPRIADPCDVRDNSIANAIAPNRISPVQIPIAPRRC
jgi:hypothetical protein